MTPNRGVDPPDLPGPARDRLSSDHHLVCLWSGDFFGVDGRPVEVQVDVSRRLKPGFVVVGLPGKSTRESRERIQAAVQNAGYRFPTTDRVTVNLAPAFQKKDGGVFDLPIALGILLATGQMRVPDRPADSPLPLGFLGELGLQGELRPVPGALLIASALRDRGVKQVVVPHGNADEVAMTPGLQVHAARDIHDAVRALGGGRDLLHGAPAWPETQPAAGSGPDFAEVRGQELAKRGLLVVAAGGHNVIMVGPPGVGKTMLASRLPGILPPLNFEEGLEVLRIYSSAGLLDGGALRRDRPFRAPHHTVSYAGLVGGGSPPRCGEITLAHRGVLFLDELPEFPRRILETLRQPMEEGRITIARSLGSVTFPARVLVCAAMNPCPCGYAGHHSGVRCRCASGAIERYRGRVSGPLLDRIDLEIAISPPPVGEVIRAEKYRRHSLSTAELREQVALARARQADRWGGTALNADVDQETLLERGGISREAKRHLAGAARRGKLSARGLGRVLRIARTVADLVGSERVSEVHLQEALYLRRPDSS